MAAEAPASRPSRRSSGWLSTPVAHFGSASAYDLECARWRLHHAATRVWSCTTALCALHASLLFVLSSADPRGDDALQASKSRCVALASLVAALASGLGGAVVTKWPQDWWLAHGARLLAALHVFAALALPVLQAQLLALAPGPGLITTVALAAPVVQGVLLGALWELAAPWSSTLQYAADGLGLALTATQRAHSAALECALGGAFLGVALARAHATRQRRPSPSAVAAWREELQRSQGQMASYLASCKQRRLTQVRTSMALSGALCLGVSAAGGMAPWHAAYNGLATCSMLLTAASPDWVLEAMFEAWPSLWAATCVALLPFHAATQQCALGYVRAPGTSCDRLAAGQMDGSNLLPFIVHVAVGPALRLPGSVCYTFLLVPVIGFMLLELPHLTAYSVTERVLLAWGLAISALLSAHGVLCCDVAEHAEHAARERLDAEKNATKQFTSYILHEVRVPFNVVRAGIDTLDASLAAGLLRAVDAAQHAAAEEMLAAMNASANHMIRIMNDTLDLSKIDQGCLTTLSEPFSADATLRGVASAWTRPAALAQVTLSLQLKPASAARLQARALVGDALRLQQIVGNLVSNALKFTPPGGAVTIAVRVADEVAEEEEEEVDSAAPGGALPAPSERVWLVVDVSDTGCGISEEDLPRLFRPYSQLVSGLRRAGGTGLGLNLSRTLCMLCGGSLSCASEAGKGSTFTARLPYELGNALPPPDGPATQPRPDAAPSGVTVLVHAPPPPPGGGASDPAAAGARAPLSELPVPPRPSLSTDDLEALANAPEASKPAPAAASPHHVLVVDDSSLSCMMMVRLLATLGVTADAAKDGRAGVDAVLAAHAGGKPYTLLIMDRNMPGMDGEAAIRALRAAGQRMPIIALSGDDEERDAMLAAGATAFLVKPASRAMLQQVLQESAAAAAA